MYQTTLKLYFTTNRFTTTQNHYLPMKNIAEKLRLMRLSRNLSQENIAENLEMSQQAYSKIERAGDPKLSVIQKISRSLGIKINDIVSDDDAFVSNVNNNTNSNIGLVVTQPINNEEQEKNIVLLSEEVELLQKKYDLLQKIKEIG
jgi:transcriptional regulator with XRE-family HTH domain